MHMDILATYDAKWKALPNDAIKQKKELIREYRVEINNAKRIMNKEENPIIKNANRKILQTHEIAIEGYNANMMNNRTVSKRTDMKEMELNTVPQVLHTAIAIQDDNLKILENIEQIGNVTESVGQEIGITTEKQTEEFGTMELRLHNLDTEVHMAKKETSWFFRRISTNKCLIWLCLMLIIGICILAGYLIYKSRQ